MQQWYTIPEIYPDDLPGIPGQPVYDPVGTKPAVPTGWPGTSQKGALIPHLPSFYRSFYRTEGPVRIRRENIQYQQVYIITVFVKYFTTLMFS